MRKSKWSANFKTKTASYISMEKVLSIAWRVNIILAEQRYKNGLLLTKCMEQMPLSAAPEMQEL